MRTVRKKDLLVDPKHDLTCRNALLDVSERMLAAATLKSLHGV